MRRRSPALAALALCLVPAAARGTAWADPPAAQSKVPDEPYPAAFRDKVAAAIRRGVDGLRAAQQPDGSWAGFHRREYPAGETALATMALLKAGVRPDDPRIADAFAWLRRTHRPKRTYEVGVVLMAIAAKYDHGDDDPAATPSADAPVKPSTPAVSAADREWMQREVEFLEKNRLAPGKAAGSASEGGGWGYPGGAPGLAAAPFVTKDAIPQELWVDVSNTQYAVFGLRAAARCGVPVAKSTWSDALTQLLAWQTPKGTPTTLHGNEVRGPTRVEWTERAKARGFGYSVQPEFAAPTGSMTSAGTAALMICADALRDDAGFGKDARAAARDGIRDGLAWVQSHFSVAKNPGREDAKYFFFYYLYGLERLGDLAHVRYFGAQDWFQQGAQVVLDRQRPDGAWGEGGVSAPVDTCFALLFLARSTTRLAHPVITPDAVPTTPGK